MILVVGCRNPTASLIFAHDILDGVRIKVATCSLLARLIDRVRLGYAALTAGCMRHKQLFLIPRSLGLVLARRCSTLRVLSVVLAESHNHLVNNLVSCRRTLPIGSSPTLLRL